MKKKGRIYPLLIVLAFFALGVLPARAVPSLWDWAFNVDGVVYEYYVGDNLSDIANLDESSFDDSTGLGTLTWETDVSGDHTFIAFFDHEVDEDTNTWFNEFGTVNGSPAAGQSWEIDEPGVVFGDIYGHVLTRSLDNTNAIPDGSNDDVSMALGWDFTLAANETATVSLILSDIMPLSGFYLSQTDPETGPNYDQDYSIFFSSTLDITGGSPGPGPAPVPEPATLLLMGIGLAGILGVQRRKGRKKA